MSMSIDNCQLLPSYSNPLQQHDQCFTLDIYFCSMFTAHFNDILKTVTECNKHSLILILNWLSIFLSIDHLPTFMPLWYLLKLSVDEALKMDRHPVEGRPMFVSRCDRTALGPKLKVLITILLHHFTVTHCWLLQKFIITNCYLNDTYKHCHLDCITFSTVIYSLVCEYLSLVKNECLFVISCVFAS